ncbi:hypothetical protein [Novosphingobium sp. 9U]|uniref:hypothetical protein n=1 Tax=Novosphingobium sp. 9U TaxID=2653158 RepID=UPI0012F33DE0|nr:hypothetical protein [Novosphingobium sp. 9U]VWX51770.1 conserved hypothetical protein [Novosphingobium sp. 9U]
MPIPIEKVLEAAQKAGFDSELKVAACLSVAGWNANQNVYFVDKDEGKGRELDVAAYRIFNGVDEKPEVTCVINLLIEVKKTADPFIFYSNKPRSYEGPRGFGLFNWSNTEPPGPLGYKGIERSRPFKNPEHLARSYAAFRDGKTNQIQSGILSAFKAAIHEQERCDETYSDVSGDICFFIPMMVVEGPLYECFFEEGADTLSAREVDEVVYMQNYHSENYGRVSNGVFIMTLRAFPAKLVELTQWGESMLATMVENRDKVKRKKPLGSTISPNPAQ